MSGKTLKHHILAILVAGVATLVVWSAPAFGALPYEFQSDDVRAAVEAGNTKTAISLLEQQINADPGYYVNYFNLGLVYFELDQYAKAQKQFEEALDRKGKHFPSMYYLGKTLIQLGKLDDAEKQMKQGLKRSKDERSWFENGMGLVDMAKKDYQDADIAFRKALAVNEEQEEKRLKELKNTKLEEAERTRLVDSVKNYFAQENGEYHINLGDANFYQGIPSLAINEYEQALAIDSGSTEVFYHWAEACLEMKDYSCAIEKLHLVLSKDSTHAPAWMRAGAIYFKAALSTRTWNERKQRFAEAIASYRKYFELTDAQPDSATIRPFFETAMSYESIYDFEDAVPYFEKVLSIPYEPKDIYFYYGKALWGTRDYVKAAEMLKKHEDWVAQQGPDYKSTVRESELYQLLGDCYFYRKPNNDFATAAKYYVKSLDSDPDQKRVLKDVAVAYHNLGEYCKAIGYYDKRIALGIDSSTEVIYKNAALCALHLAQELKDKSSGGGGDEGFGEEFASAPADDPCATSGVNYYQKSIDYMQEYLKAVPGDTTIIFRIADTYLFRMLDFANGVAYFQKLLTLAPDNCLAKRSLGYAYFNIEGHKDYTKALKYFLDAYDCFTSSGGACADPETVKWIAQCYHLRAASKTEGAAPDYEKAFNWYGKYLKCKPSDAEAIKAQNDIRYEF